MLTSPLTLDSKIKPIGKYNISFPTFVIVIIFVVIFEEICVEYFSSILSGWNHVRFRLKLFLKD